MLFRVLFLLYPKLGDFFAGIGCVRSHLGQKTLWHTDLCTHIKQWLLNNYFAFSRSNLLLHAGAQIYTHSDTQESIVSCPNLRGELFGLRVGTKVGMWLGLDVTNAGSNCMCSLSSCKHTVWVFVNSIVAVATIEPSLELESLVNSFVVNDVYLQQNV